jgi:hypothetical protein
VIVERKALYGKTIKKLDNYLLVSTGIVKVPELDMAVPDGDEVTAVLRKINSFDFRGNLVAGNLGLAPPVPHVHDLVVLRAHGHQILLIRGKRLRTRVQQLRGRLILTKVKKKNVFL